MQAWNKLGINIGNNFNWTTTYPSSQVKEDLDFLWSEGIRHIRVACPEWDNAGGIENCLQACADALAMGFTVFWGVSSSGTNVLTSSNIANYRSKVVELAATAQSMGITTYSVGNELEYFNDNTTLTDAQLRTHVRDCATDCQAVFLGEIGYSIAQGTQNANWISDGILGGIDVPYLNVYGDANNFAYFKTELNSFLNKFNNGRISEWNIDSTDSDIQSLSMDNQQADLASRFSYIQEKGISIAYFFTWRWSGTDQFAVKKSDNSMRYHWWEILRRNRLRKWFIY